MTIQDDARFLADLIIIMDFHEDLGTTKNVEILAEFKRVHEQLVKGIQDETRARANRRSSGTQERAYTQISPSDSGGSARPTPEPLGTTVRRPGV